MQENLETMIRERAYEIWQEEGCPEGREADHWAKAAAECNEAVGQANREVGDAPPSPMASPAPRRPRAAPSRNSKSSKS